MQCGLHEEMCDILELDAGHLATSSQTHVIAKGTLVSYAAAFVKMLNELSTLVLQPISSSQNVRKPFFERKEECIVQVGKQGVAVFLKESFH